MDKRTGRPKGDCTVSFEESETARAAIKWYDGKCFGVRRACSRARRAAPSASRAPRTAPHRTAPHRTAPPATRRPVRTTPTRSCPSPSPSVLMAPTSAREGAREGARAIELRTLRSPAIIIGDDKRGWRGGGGAGALSREVRRATVRALVRAVLKPHPTGEPCEAFVGHLRVWSDLLTLQLTADKNTCRFFGAAVSGSQLAFCPLLHSLRRLAPLATVAHVRAGEASSLRSWSVR